VVSTDADQRHPAMHQPTPQALLGVPGEHRPDDHQQAMCSDGAWL
jgi:hypothetical protein